MKNNGNIATLVEESVGTKVETVYVKCGQCGDKVPFPIDDYNAMLGDKNWKGAWIRYTPKELESKYSKDELKKIESMTEHERDFYVFKVLTKDNVYCNLKCNCFFTDD